MSPDHNQQHSRRPHYHRGRRGPDRRGGDRRPQQQQQQSTQTDNSNRDQFDVEQIMREIRSRISEKHGIDLTAQQIQELAARRLEAILDPRAIKPSLMDELRRAAGLPADATTSDPEAAEAIEESALYASESGFLHSIRRLLNPLLKLLIDPKAIVEALNAQSRKTKAAAAREAELRRRQTEWNGLHFEILRRLVTDVARAEIDNQHLAHRVESLQARVDFNERRVRALEHAQQQQPLHHSRPPNRPSDAPVLSAAAVSSPRADDASPTDHAASSADASAEASRRRRRRRRGRRSGQPRDLTGAPAPGLAASGATEQVDQGPEGADFGDEEDGAEDPVHVAPPEPDHAPAPSEITSTPEPAASTEESDPVTREQS